MSATSRRLEACLVLRRDFGEGTKYFWVEILGVEVNSRSRFLKTFEPNAGGTIMACLSVGSYYILQTRLIRPDGQKEGVDSWATNLEDQNDAFESLRVFFEGEGGVDLITRLLGQETENPKRIEVALRSKRMVPPGTKHERQGIITSFMGKDSTFNYHSLTIQAWSVPGKSLLSQRQSLKSEDWDIRELTVYQGGAKGALTEKFFAVDSDQNKAWGRLSIAWGAFTSAETGALNKFVRERSLENGPDEDAHYYNRIPSIYKPKPPTAAHFRVAGDEIGLAIHKEQQSKKAEDPGYVLEAKKAGNPTPRQNNTTATSSKVSASEGIFCDCNSPTCPSCIIEKQMEQHFQSGYSRLLH